MQTIAPALTQLSDAQLLVEVEQLAGRERAATAQLIASLAEIETRGLYRGLGFSSMFSYCTEHLHLSEHATCNRLEVARAARKWPVILDLIANGSVTLTAVRLLAPSLTRENHAAVLAAARHKSKREVQELIARLRPAPDVAATVRKLPAPKSLTPAAPTPSLIARADAAEDASAARDSIAGARPVGMATGATPRPSLTPLAPERYRIEFTISRETRDTLRRVQDLLGRSVPAGDPSVVFDRALSLLLADLEKRRFAQTDRPQAPRPGDPASRYIPAAVRRDVWARDGGRCAFVGSAGRCAATRFLEFHHLVPYADGGPTVAANLQMRCRVHNAYEAELHFGPMFAREDHISYAPAGASFAACPRSNDLSCHDRVETCRHDRMRRIG
jgi:hypothetical protein